MMASPAPYESSAEEGSADGWSHDSLPEAETARRGELFEYQLSSPLDVCRGQSTVVPLVRRSVKTSKERIYRRDRGANPDYVVTFENTTDLVLEEGAVVLYDGHEYAGEAMLPTTAQGSTVRLAYGSDQALTCTLETSNT